MPPVGLSEEAEYRTASPWQLNLSIMAGKSDFVTLWRSIAAYAISVAVGGVAFVFGLVVESILNGCGSLFALCGPLDRVYLHNVAVAVHDALLMLLIEYVFLFVILAPILLPLYAAGMVLARKWAIRHWAFFAGGGVVLSIAAVFGLGVLKGLTHSRRSMSFDWGVSLELYLPLTVAGAIGGMACWLFLRWAERRDGGGV